MIYFSIFYLSTIIAGASTNNYYEMRAYTNALKKVKKKLLFDDGLCEDAKDKYDHINSELVKNLFKINAKNLLPVLNVYQSLYKIFFNDLSEMNYEEYLSCIVNRVNKIEFENRRFCFEIFKTICKEFRYETEIDLSTEILIKEEELKRLLKTYNFECEIKETEKRVIKTVSKNNKTLIFTKNKKELGL